MFLYTFPLLASGDILADSFFQVGTGISDIYAITVNRFLRFTLLSCQIILHRSCRCNTYCQLQCSHDHEHSQAVPAGRYTFFQPVRYLHRKPCWHISAAATTSPSLPLMPLLRRLPQIVPQTLIALLEHSLSVLPAPPKTNEIAFVVLLSSSVPVACGRPSSKRQPLPSELQVRSPIEHGSYQRQTRS